jgi:hypothetical protein
MFLTQLKLTRKKGDILKMIKEHQNTEAIVSDKVKTCQSCANMYLLVWLKKSRDYNDFGLKYCPFCGLLTDELTGDVMV